MTKNEVHRIAEANYRRHCKRVEETLRTLIPLVSAYLKDAPSHPDNAILEDAKALVIEYGPSTGEPSTSVPAARKGGLHFTEKEKRVMRGAINSYCSGEHEGSVQDIAALKRALEKLQ